MSITGLIREAFWALALAQIVLSVSFIVRLNVLSKKRRGLAPVRLAKGLQLDGWLAGAAMWLAYAVRAAPIAFVVDMLGAAVLVWLMIRAARRLVQLREILRLAGPAR